MLPKWGSNLDENTDRKLVYIAYDQEEDSEL